MSPLASALAAILVAANAPVIPNAEHEFHFVVLGDSQFHNPPAFNRIIDDTRTLRPAFVVQVGDMIRGYTDDVAGVRNEWRRFKNQIAPLAPVPYVPVPGNHDLYGGGKVPTKKVEAIYRETWGPTYHSFEYANTRLIVLNTDAPGSERSIDNKQWRWLVRTLENNKAEHTMVFMHRPPQGLVKAKALHALFVEHNVSHVFYGHRHHYHFHEQDGVRYIMTNAAADMGTRFAEVGSFHHLLQVTVRDADVDVAVIKAGAIVPLRSVTMEDNQGLFTLVRRLTDEKMHATATGPRSWTSQLRLTNPISRDITAQVHCSSPDHRWQVTPRQVPQLHLAPQSSQAVVLEWSYLADRVPEGQPSCSVTVPYQTSLGTWLYQRLEVAVTGLN